MKYFIHYGNIRTEKDEDTKYWHNTEFFDTRLEARVRQLEEYIKKEKSEKRIRKYLAKIAKIKGDNSELFI